MLTQPLIALVATLLVSASVSPGHVEKPMTLDASFDGVLTSSEGACRRLRESAGLDTFAIFGGPGTLEGKFETAHGAPDRQGWIGVDITDIPHHWQRSTFNAGNLNGNGPTNHAYWCGQDASQVSGWQTPPGYGNNWDDILVFTETVSDPSEGQAVLLDFVFNHDSEPGYDYFTVSYDSSGSWTQVLELDGTNREPGGEFAAPGVRYADVATGAITYLPHGYAGPGGDEIRIRIRFESDGAWSDEDGYWPTGAGAVQLDDLSITTSEGAYFENFEGVGPYMVVAERAPFAGDFSIVFGGLTDIDVCADNRTPVMTFIDAGQAPPNGPGTTGIVSTGGSFSTNWSYGTPRGHVVNYTGGLSENQAPLYNEVWSPEIAWDLAGPEDDHADVRGAIFRFDVFNHLPLMNGMFFVWHVRSAEAGADWSSWEDRNFVYYSQGAPFWQQKTMDVTDLLVDAPERVQIGLGVVDFAQVFGFPGSDATPSPLFDNVTFKKYRVGGPMITTREIDLANDAFPASNTLTVLTEAERDAMDVRFDMARDVNYAWGGSSRIVPGDSITVDVRPLLPGTAVASVRMRWALRKNDVFEDAIRQAPSRPVDRDVSAQGMVWTGIVDGLPTYTTAGTPIEGRWNFDLPDEDFLYPGDQLHYVFEAEDTDGRLTTLPADTHGFGIWDYAGGSSYNRTHVVRALPTVHDAAGLQPETLVIYAGRRGVAEDDYLLSMRELRMTEGVDFDTYSVQGVTSRVSNGIGATEGHGPSATQMRGYENLLYLTGNMFFGVLSDGSNSGSNDKGDDLGVLTAWHDLQGPRHAAFLGDNIASSLTNGGYAGQIFLRDVLGVVFEVPNVSDVIDGQVSPLVVPLSGPFWTEFIAQGGCPLGADFDAIRPTLSSTSVAGHGWTTPYGIVVTEYAASVINDRVLPTGRKIDFTMPIRLKAIQQPMMRSVVRATTRSRVLEEILHLFGVSVYYPVSAPEIRKASLAVAPNPFNPRTTVRLELPRIGAARIEVFNIRGERIRVLHDGELPAGDHPFVWDGTDGRGTAVASGVYMVRARAAGVVLVEKVALVK